MKVYLSKDVQKAIDSSPLKVPKVVESTFRPPPVQIEVRPGTRETTPFINIETDPGGHVTYIHRPNVCGCLPGCRTTKIVRLG